MFTLWPLELQIHTDVVSVLEILILHSNTIMFSWCAVICGPHRTPVYSSYDKSISLYIILFRHSPYSILYITT
jgi:hypothetical protein